MPIGVTTGLQRIWLQEDTMTSQLVIKALASYLPEHVVTNEDLVKRYPQIEVRDGVFVENTPKQIFKRCGISERRYVEDGMFTSDMAVEAIQSLLVKTEVSLDEIDMIIVATSLPDCFFPSTAAIVIDKLGMKRTKGFDIGAACSGSIFGIEQAAMGILAGGPYAGRLNKIIVVSSDVVSRAIGCYKNYRTGILFGDAAVAVLIERESAATAGFRINNTLTEVIPDFVKDVYFISPWGLPAGKNWADEQFELDGGAVYERGVGFTKEFVGNYCEHFNVNLDKVDYFIPHQANIRMLDNLRDELQLGERLLSNIEYVGNTVASSTTLCLLDFQERGQFKKGDQILVCSFGAGYTLGMLDLEAI